MNNLQKALDQAFKALSAIPVCGDNVELMAIARESRVRLTAWRAGRRNAPMADKTTGGLPAVTEAAIGDLPGIADLYDDTLLPVEQQGEARHMTGAQWKAYAQAGVSLYVEIARENMEDARASAAAAQNSAAAASESASDAAESAETAQQYSGKPPVIIDGRWWIKLKPGR